MIQISVFCLLWITLSVTVMHLTRECCWGSDFFQSFRNSDVICYPHQIKADSCLHIVFIKYKMKIGAANASLHFYKANSMALFAIYSYPDLVKFLVVIKLCTTTSDKILFGFDGWFLVCFGFYCFSFLGREEKSSTLSIS